MERWYLEQKKNDEKPQTKKYRSVAMRREGKKEVRAGGRRRGRGGGESVYVAVPDEEEDSPSSSRYNLQPVQRGVSSESMTTDSCQKEG